MSDKKVTANVFNVEVSIKPRYEDVDFKSIKEILVCFFDAQSIYFVGSKASKNEGLTAIGFLSLDQVGELCRKLKALNDAPKIQVSIIPE